MRFTATVDTDIGNGRSTNQDSSLMKHAICGGKEILLAMVCDGMGGLSKGELASATVIRRFREWFDRDMEKELEALDMRHIGQQWQRLIQDIHKEILLYGARAGICLGTTFTGILFVDDRYLVGHVGDTRAYYLNRGIWQLTEDETLVAREVRRGVMTVEQAKKDSRRNVLLQCIGASGTVFPRIRYGTARQGVYLICSDGLCHEITEQELAKTLHPDNLMDKEAMHLVSRYLIELVKARREQDNITAILVKAE